MKKHSLSDLAALFREKRVRLPKHPQSLVPEQPVALPEGADELDEDELFRQAMVGVTPIHLRGRAEKGPAPEAPELTPETNPEDREAVARLEELVRFGKGFIVSQTPEYMSGRAPSVHPSIPERLYRGDFSLQGHIDLHGMVAGDAGKAVDAFLKDSVDQGKRAVLIVHGRELSSPSGPVLKHLVASWLTTGRWRRWVLAFSSARPCDGGAGATVVLLRRLPAARRKMKKFEIYG